MEFLIITGLSGAGKTRAADFIEDFGYYCVDNMPVAMMCRFAEFCMASGGRYEKVAFVSDIRDNGAFDQLIKGVEELKTMDCHCRVLFMNADIRTLVRRYKETRRKHPLAKRGETLEDSIRREIQMIQPVKEIADYIIDSSNQPLNRLQHKLEKVFLGKETKDGIDINVISFGYKYGIPADADLVLDVRFLPNPFYVDELRPQCGLDSAVMEYVFSYQQTVVFMEKLEDIIEFLLPHYAEEGKPVLNIAIGCTGGRHRSVAIANALNMHLVAKNINSTLINRDIDK